MNRTLPTVLAVLALAFQTASAQGLFSDIGDQLNEKLEARALSGIEPAPKGDTGRRPSFEQRAGALGVRPTGIDSEQRGDTVLIQFFDDLDAIEAERAALVSQVRQSELAKALGRSFLQSVFDGKALDIETREPLPDFDKAFITECASANDMVSLRHWEKFRKLLLEGELPTLDPTFLEQAAIRMPPQFSRDYPIYKETIDRIFVPVASFDAALPERITALQQRAGEQFFATYSDRITSMPRPEFARMQQIKAPLESDPLTRALVVVMREAAPTGGTLPLSEPPTPAAPPLPPSPQPVVTNELPQRPTRPEGPHCRVITIVLPGSQMSTLPSKLAGKEDFTDLVKFGGNIRKASIAAIRANGQPIAWDDTGNRISGPENAGAVSIQHNYGAPQTLVTWLNQEGQIHSPAGQMRPDLPPIVHYARPQGVFFAIDESGTRHLWGSEKDSPSVRPLANRLQEVSDLAGRGSKGYGLHTRQGQFIQVIEGKEQIVATTGVRAVFGIWLGQLESGELIGPNGPSVQFIEAFNAGPLFPISKMVFREGVAAISGGVDRRWQIWEQTSRGGDWERSKTLEIALAHAVDIHVAEGRLVHALIPANLIPRSGIWTIEDLHSHNNTLAGSVKSKPFPTGAPIAAPVKIAEVTPSDSRFHVAPLGPPTSLPRNPCRLVSVQIGSQPLLENAAVTSVARDDFTDLVRLAKSAGHNRIGAIRANGQPVAWFAQHPAFIGNSPSPAISASANFFEGSPVVWLDETGTLYSSNGPIPTESRITQFYESSNLVLAIGEDGSRSFFGRGMEEPQFKLAFPEPSMVQSFDGLSMNFLDVLYQDGRLVRVQQGTVLPFGEDRATQLFSHNLGWREGGQFYARGVPLADFEGLTSPPTKAFSRGELMAFQVQGGFTFYQKVVGGWKRASKWDQAFAGATDVYMQSFDFVHALIPADKVPRSGLWTLDELTEYRRNHP